MGLSANRQIDYKTRVLEKYGFQAPLSEEKLSDCAFQIINAYEHKICDWSVDLGLLFTFYLGATIGSSHGTGFEWVNGLTKTFDMSDAHSLWVSFLIALAILVTLIWWHKKPLYLIEHNKLVAKQNREIQ